jgi:periplasmic protein CpxP/Spy
MSNLRLNPPVLRTLAVASLIGAALLSSPTMAQTAEPKPPAAAAATSSKPETVEQRIVSLKASLNITADQEKKWDAVAGAMRENASAMDKLITAKRAQKAASMTAVDDLKTYQEFSQAHLDGLKNLIPDFKALYDSMSAEQKANADQVFQKYGPQGSAQQG